MVASMDFAEEKNMLKKIKHCTYNEWRIFLEWHAETKLEIVYTVNINSVNEVESLNNVLKIGKDMLRWLDHIKRMSDDWQQIFCILEHLMDCLNVFISYMYTYLFHAIFKHMKFKTCLSWSISWYFPSCVPLSNKSDMICIPSI